MGIFNQSSSPLSSLIPQSSPYQMPDYANAFRMNMQPQMNNLKFRVGLATSNSSDPLIALNGKNMMNDAIDPNSPDSQLLQRNDSGGVSFGWDQGFNALSQIGSKIGGQAGNILNGAGKIGSSIKMISQANKGIKAGLEGAKSAKMGGIGATIGAASDLVGSFMPQKTEYDGAKGDITQTMDSVYDGISDAAMSFGPAGMLVGGIMKGGALLGKGLNALGGGTDGMTSTDAILGSSFLSLTPIGLVNGFGGKKADTITKDNDAFAQVGSSYTGSESSVNDALQKSGKKYGLFSSGARKRANEEIAEAKRQQNIISDISQDIQDRTAIRTAMAAINGNRRGFHMQGGYDQAAIRVGRRGMSIELLNKARSILKAQKGSKLDPMNTYKNLAPKDWEIIPDSGKPSYQEWIKDFNPDFISPDYDLETAYNNLPYEQLQRHKFAVNQKTRRDQDYYLKYHDENGYYPFHLGSVAPIQGTEDYIFLKKGKEDTNPEVHWETDTYYNGRNGLKDTHDLVYEGDRYYYRKKKSKQDTPQHKNGGSIIELISETTINLVNPLDIPEFQNGGSINVIPDGALHARKHNMDLEGITEKGIPVVSEKDNGKIEQQAEIEKEEVIFRLEVTQKLEELEKKYYSEEASQKEKDEYALEAGKLITEELLHNTKDNAGLL